jgi:hypothetical protein
MRRGGSFSRRQPCLGLLKVCLDTTCLPAEWAWPRTRPFPSVRLRASARRCDTSRRPELTYICACHLREVGIAGPASISAVDTPVVVGSRRGGGVAADPPNPLTLGVMPACGWQRTSPESD